MPFNRTPRRFSLPLWFNSLNERRRPTSKTSALLYITLHYIHLVLPKITCALWSQILTTGDYDGWGNTDIFFWLIFHQPQAHIRLIECVSVVIHIIGAPISETSVYKPGQINLHSYIPPEVSDPLTLKARLYLPLSELVVLQVNATENQTGKSSASALPVCLVSLVHSSYAMLPPRMQPRARRTATAASTGFVETPAPEPLTARVLQASTGTSVKVPHPSCPDGARRGLPGR